jgi:hypothetical protein
VCCPAAVRNQNQDLVLAWGVDYNSRMICMKRALAVLSSCFLLAPIWHAVAEPTSERNYRVIIDRNPFGLKPPPPPATNAPVAPQPKEEYFLTGLTSIGGLRAYFMTKPSPTKKEPEYYSLGVDEKKDGLEVLSIDLNNQSVRVRSGGIENVMSFASHGVKPPAAPALAAGAPGAPLVRGAPGTPGAAVTLPAISTARGTTVAPHLPAGITPPATPGASSALSPSVTPVTTAASRVRTIPSRAVRTPVMDPAMAQRYGINPGDGQAPPQPNPLTSEAEILMLELQKAANPNVQFPPTPLPP